MPIQSSPIASDAGASAQRNASHSTKAQDTASAVQEPVTPFLDGHPASPLEQLYQLDLNDDTANRMLAQLVEYLAITTPSPRNGSPQPNQRMRTTLSPKDTPTFSVSTPSSTPAIRIVEVEPLGPPSSMNRDSRVEHELKSSPATLIGLGIFNHSRLLPSSHFSGSSASDSHGKKSKLTSRGRPRQNSRSTEQPPRHSDKENFSTGGERLKTKTILTRSDDATASTRRVLKSRHVHIISPEKPNRTSYTSTEGASKKLEDKISCTS